MNDMGGTSWQVKKRYNQKVYKRISADLPKDLVDEFKELCKVKDISQAQVIKELIEEWMKKEG